MKNLCEPIPHIKRSKWLRVGMNFASGKAPLVFQKWHTALLLPNDLQTNETEWLAAVTHRYKADAHFASKNTLLKRNTLLLKSLTHFASKSTLQSHDLLLSTPCSLTPFATQNLLLLITPCFSAHSAPQNTLLLSTLCFKEPFTPQHTLLLNTLCFLTPFAPWNTLLLRIFLMPWFT